MKHCSLCRLEVDTDKEYCPLCYNHLTEVSKKETPEMFNLEKHEPRKKRRVMVAKVFLIISLAILSACIYINVVTKTIAWSVVVGLSMLYVWVLVSHTIMSRDTPFKKVFFQLVVIIALLVATNKIFSSNDWLTNYVYPSLALLVTVVLTMIILCSKHRKKMLFGFFEIFFLLLVVSCVFVGLKIDKFELLNHINIIYQCLTIIAFTIFGWKTIVSEASRKFHI